MPEAGANNGSPTQQASFKRKKRRRYKKKVPTASMTTVEIQKAELEPKKIAENTATPSNAHPLDEHVSTSAESDEQGESVDLLKCEEVNYETRNRAPGVRFRMPDGEEGWTPIVRKRSRSRRQDRMLRQDEDSGSDSDSDLRRAITAKKITYSIKDSVPGLRIQRANTMSSVSWYLSNPAQLHLEQEPVYMNHSIS